MIYRFRDMIYPAGMISADADDIRLRRMLGNLHIAPPAQYIILAGASISYDAEATSAPYIILLAIYH